MRVPPENMPNTMKFLQRDFPALVIQTAGVECTDQYLQDVIIKANAVAKMYDSNNEFVNHMIKSYLDYIDIIYKRRMEIEENRTK